jgi:ABC-type phosphate transport system ATPase subunit
MISLNSPKNGIGDATTFSIAMSIYGNIAYGLKIKGIRNKKIINGKVEKHLREVALWDEVKDRLKNFCTKAFHWSAATFVFGKGTGC